MLKLGRGQESLNGMLISEEFSKDSKTNGHKKFNNPNKITCPVQHSTNFDNSKDNVIFL